MLLLDEATAALDLNTEAEVARATELLAAPRTTLVVAHRLTTAASADRVLVMDQGRVVEDGTHAELLALDGYYSRMWEAFSHTQATSEPGFPEVPGRRALVGRLIADSSPDADVGPSKRWGARRTDASSNSSKRTGALAPKGTASSARPHT